MSAGKCCKTCALFDAERAKDKAGRFVFHARCLWVSTEAYPASVPGHNSARPKARYVGPKGGGDCACYAARDGAR
jgi:hypothetical protein